MLLPYLKPVRSAIGVGMSNEYGLIAGAGTPRLRGQRPLPPKDGVPEARVFLLAFQARSRTYDDT